MALSMDSDEEISSADYQALAELRYQLRRFLRLSEEAVRARGLKPQQHQLLLALKGLPGGRRATIGELAERLQVQHHSAVELIDRLVERGFVVRARDGTDQRKVLITLTLQGEKVLQELSLYHRAELRSAGPALIRALNELINGTNNTDISHTTPSG
jgi:DNA-binding MarR family transcriptional regulator